MSKVHEERIYLEAAVLGLLGLWGLISLVQGAALTMFVAGNGQGMATAFIGLVYDSVFVGVLISLFSARLASIACFTAAMLAATVLYSTNSFGHGWNTGKSLLESIAIRPAFAALLLFMLPGIGPVGRPLFRWWSSSSTG